MYNQYKKINNVNNSKISQQNISRTKSSTDIELEQCTFQPNINKNINIQAKVYDWIHEENHHTILNENNNFDNRIKQSIEYKREKSRSRSKSNPKNKYDKNNNYEFLNNEVKNISNMYKGTNNKNININKSNIFNNDNNIGYLDIYKSKQYINKLKLKDEKILEHKFKKEPENEYNRIIKLQELNPPLC